jgi:ferredoxin-NADP reductase
MQEYLFPLTARNKVAENTFEYRFDTKGNNYSFKPGQYAYFTLINPPFTDELGNERIFSFVNPPGAIELVIVLRYRDTAYKKSLQAIPLGTNVQVTRPIGYFDLPDSLEQPIVFIAGGVGIAPILSVLAWLFSRNDTRKLCLFYLNRSPETAPYLDLLQERQKRHANFKIVSIYSRLGNSKRFAITDLHKEVDDIYQPLYHVVGAPDMVEGINKLLRENGINPKQIKTEAFTGYETNN